MGFIRFMKSIPRRINDAGGLGSITGGAIGWLGMGLRILGIVSPKMRAKINPLEKGIMTLIKMESKHSNANFWALNQQAAESSSRGGSVQLVIDGVEFDYGPSAEYGSEFKRKWFDRFFKRPLIELRSVFDIDNDGVIDWLELPEDIDDEEDEG